MKVTFNLVITLFLYSFTHGQEISIDDVLTKTSCKTFTCFNNFIVKKGFSYWNTSELDGNNMYGFSSDKKVSSPEGVTGRNTAWLYYDEKHKYSAVSINTINKDYYLDLKEQLAVKGFKETHSESTGVGGLRVFYKSKNHPKISIKILIERLTEKNLSWTSYDFEVKKTDLN